MRTTDYILNRHCTDTVADVCVSARGCSIVMESSCAEEHIRDAKSVNGCGVKSRAGACALNSLQYFDTAVRLLQQV